MNIYVESYQKSEDLALGTNEAQHKLQRRMTSIQKIGLATLNQAISNSSNLQKALKDESSLIYTSTCYGELSSMSKILQSLANQDFPCSPLAFQHSVHNALAGYLGIINQLQNKTVTLGSGPLAFDRALYFAFHKLKQNICRYAVIVHADDKIFADQEARAQVICLSNTEAKETQSPLFELTSIEHRHAGKELDQAAPEAPIYIDQLVFETSFTRTAIGLKGEKIESTWVKRL